MRVTLRGIGAASAGARRFTTRLPGTTPWWHRSRRRFKSNQEIYDRTLASLRWIACDCSATLSALWRRAFDGANTSTRLKHDDLAAESALLPFSDSFERANGALNNGWVEGWSATKNYSKLGIFSHAAAMDAPTIRNGTYPPPGNDSCSVIVPGEMLAGIGCAWRETRATSVSVSVRWSGLWRFPHHIEVAPLLHVTPGTRSFGIGIWSSILYGKPVPTPGNESATSNAAIYPCLGVDIMARLLPGVGLLHRHDWKPRTLRGYPGCCCL